MLGFTAIRTQRQPMLGCAIFVVAGVFVPARAHAHFVLVTPDASMLQDPLGQPEKVGPCGDEGGGTPTGKVTAFRPGQTIAVTIYEVVPHPGHYRVALAVNDRSELPPEPVVTSTQNDPCGRAAIQSPPTFPILADNVLPHVQAFAAPQTFAVTLPSDVTCSKCTLQVLEFMSSHGAPCFYHHCADISIQALDTASPTASLTATDTPTATSTPPQTPTSTETASPTEEAAQTPTPSVTPTPPQTSSPCIGDCDEHGTVTVDEILMMVHIALTNADVSACVAGDVNHDQTITIDEILTAANSAVNGCADCGDVVCPEGERCCNPLLSICTPTGVDCVL